MDIQSRPVNATRDKASKSSWPLTIKRRSTVAMQKPKGRHTASNCVRARRCTKSLSVTSNSKMAAAEENPRNALEWLQQDCLEELLPKILSYAGPQTMSHLNRTNRYFHQILQQEDTWRVVCEELYKWKPGDEEPESWKEFYRSSPCVPTDFSTIRKALQTASPSSRHLLAKRKQGAVSQQEQIRSVRVLLRPGIYSLKQTLQINSSVTVTFESLQLPHDLYQSSTPPRIFVEEEGVTEIHRPLRTRLREMFSCKRVTVEDVYSTELFLDASDDSFDHFSPSRAMVVFRSLRPNEPAFHLKQGHLVLRGLDIRHSCEGTDIWNGNAAVQIQPDPSSSSSSSNNSTSTSAILEQVSVTSQTGRGVVNIDGGDMTLRHCVVQDCAATGVYVGGPGSQATVDSCDVLRNGVGNLRCGLARGHSGVYLEQGKARVWNCQISCNTLTGISAVNHANAILTLEGSDLVANGSNQLELPALGSTARNRTVVRDNQIAVRGTARYRSGLVR